MPYLIDGHNLIGQMPGLSLTDPDDERKLVELLRRYLLRRRKKGTVVFDKGLPGGPSPWSTSTLAVHFAAQGSSADAVIVRRLQRERNAGGLVVVSGDGQIVAAARRAGASVVAPADFARELAESPRPEHKKQAGLTPEEAAAWEEEFKKRKK